MHVRQGRCWSGLGLARRPLANEGFSRRREPRTLTALSGMLVACWCATSAMAQPGLPHGETFLTPEFRDDAQTTANWSTEEQAVYLQWRGRTKSSGLSFTKTSLGTSMNYTQGIVAGDIDGDSDLDIVAVNGTTALDPGEINRVYVNDGDSLPFDSIGAGSPLGNSSNSSWSVAVGDVDGDGDLDIVVGNNDSSHRLYLNDGDSEPFDSAGDGELVSYGAYAIALGDMDGDGDLDAVAGSFGGDYTEVIFNDGDDTPFSPHRAEGVYDSQGLTHDIALGDVDGDGDLDIVAANGGTGQQYSTVNRLYLNQNEEIPFDYEFETVGLDIGTDADDSASISLGDVDGDGDLDVVVGNTGDFSGDQQNKLYLNDGDDSPFDSISAGIGVGSASYRTFSVALGDVDNDGDLDILEGNDQQAPRLILNDGGPSLFDSAGSGFEIAFVGYHARSVAFADVDGDNLMDIIVGNYGQNNHVYFNTSAALPIYESTFGETVGTDFDSAAGIALGDVDGDGDLDVVAGNDGETNKLYLNDGDGAPFDSVAMGDDVGTDTDSTRAIALGDVDGDGDLDVVAGNIGQTNKLYLNDGDGAPFDSVTTGDAVGTETDSTWAITLGDVDGDGDLDVISGDSGVTNKLYLNDGDSAPFDSVTTGDDVGTDTDSTRAIALGDVDGDGDLDVVAGSIGQTNKLYLNDGDGAPFDSVATGDAVGTEMDSTWAITLGDVDGDGDLDIVAGDSGVTNKLYLNDGTGDPFGSITTGEDVGTDMGSTRAITLGDVDADGDLDIVVGYNGATNSYYLNDGDSAPFDSVGAGAAIGTDTDGTFGIALGDMDGDGSLDVVAGDYGDTN